MRYNQASKRGWWFSFLVAGVTGYLLGDWHAIALRSTGLSASQNVALIELSASQNVALRFPEAKADTVVVDAAADAQASATRLPEPGNTQLAQASVQGAAAKEDAPLSPPETVTARQVVKIVAADGVPVVPTPAAPELVSPAPLVQLLGLHAVPALPPIGHSRFCLRYPDECQVHGIDFRRRNIELTLERANKLNIVNLEVNRDIVAKVTAGNGLIEEWLISPRVGDCKDYAITKRHELLARGWPSRALLLSEVVAPSGEHHLVLVVRTKDVDLVLDNLNDDIQSVATTYAQYHWVRIQSPQNPKVWVRVTDANHTAMLSN